MIRSIVFVIWMYGLMLVMGLLCLPLLLFSRRGITAAMGLWGRLVRLGLRWISGVRTELRGLEHVPDRPFIYAAKHQAMYDIIAPFLMFPDPAIILKRELLYYPIFGWYSLRAGMIPIDRSGTVKTLKAMVRVAADRSRRGRSIVIFPEGTRKPPGAPPDYKIGIFALYKALGVPCLPVATNSGLHWPAHGLRRYPGTITFEALAPIPPGLDRKTFMARLEAAIEPASNALVQDTDQDRRKGPSYGVA